MAWLSSIFEGESMAANLIVITVSLVVVLLLLFWLFRKIAGSNKIRGSRNRRPRLAVTDAAVVDDKRRLVLVRRDNVEHLVLIGGASDVLIEQNIIRVQSASAARSSANIENADIEQSEQSLDQQDDIPKPVGISAGALVDKVATEAVSPATISKQSGTTTGRPGESAKEVAASASSTTKRTAVEPDAAPVQEVSAASVPEAKAKDSPPAKKTTPTPAPAATAVKMEPEPAAIDKISDLEADLSSEFGELLNTEKLEVGSLDFTPAEITTPEKATPVASPKAAEPNAKPSPTAPTAAPKAPEAAAPKPNPDQAQSAGDDMEDEMQKLLRELSGEKSS